MGWGPSFRHTLSQGGATLRAQVRLPGCEDLALHLPGRSERDGLTTHGSLWAAGHVATSFARRGLAASLWFQGSLYPYYF